MNKPIIFSGIQPSGNLHIGNYLGAIKQWVEMQAAYQPIFCVVDYHALTVPQKPKEFRKKIIETARVYLAAGIDPVKSIIFQQSDVKEHAELAWILNTIARLSDLYKMTQFKDKGGEKQNAGAGLFNYPVLMAADILLYSTKIVPVGDDQVQHVELARELARRFNRRFGEIFIVPTAKVMKEGARIMGLDNPEKKMSKSASSEYNYIALTDDPAKAKNKIMKAVADSGVEVKYDPKNKPGISNLLAINSLLAGQGIKDLEKEYQGMMYGDFKKKVAAEVGRFLEDFQAKYQAVSDDVARKVLDEGANRARPIAAAMMEKVRRAVGIK